MGTKPLAYFLNFHFQRENDTIARDMPQAQAKWLPLLPNFEHANLVSGSQHARKSFGEGEVALAAKGLSLAPANLFLTLASLLRPSSRVSRRADGSLVTFANHYATPAICEVREFVEVGGLIIAGPPDRSISANRRAYRPRRHQPSRPPLANKQTGQTSIGNRSRDSRISVSRKSQFLG